MASKWHLAVGEKPQFLTSMVLLVHPDSTAASFPQREQCKRPRQKLGLKF